MRTRAAIALAATLVAPRTASGRPPRRDRDADELAAALDCDAFDDRASEGSCAD